MRNFITSMLGALLALVIFTTGAVLLFIGFIGTIVALGQQRKAPEVASGSYLVFDLSSNITDSPPPIDFGDLQNGAADTMQLRTLTRAIRYAAHDGRIKGILLLGNLTPSGYGSGYAAMREVRLALGDFRASGKPVKAFLDYATTKDFYLASVANDVALDPYGMIIMPGLASQPIFYAGFFEELTPEQMDRQITTTLIGAMNVTRAVLPVMRKQRSGHVATISSSAGFAGFEYGSAYAASKFAVDGWMESIAPEIAPFGIHATVVNPGFFRTELLTKESTNYAPTTIADYAERNAAQHEFWDGMNGKQEGDPVKLAQALVTITEMEQPPPRFIAGSDAIAQAEEKLAERQQQIDALRDLSSSLAFTDASAGAGGTA